MELLLVSTWDRESLDGRKAVCGHMSQGPSSTHSEFDIDLNQFLSSPFFFSLGLEKSQDLESDDYPPPHTHTINTCQKSHCIVAFSLEFCCHFPLKTSKAAQIQPLAFFCV